MPSKKPSPLENPPSASSSEASSSDDGEEEVEAPSQEETPQKPQETIIKKPEASSSSSSSEEASENESGDEDGESDGEDDESDDGEEETEKGNNNTTLPIEVKPISSKPMNIDPKPKRRLEEVEEEVDEKDEKDLRKDKKKKKVSDLVEGGGEDVVVGGGGESEKKKESGVNDDGKRLFQRVWSDEDEYVILKGMLSLKKKGMDPSAPSNSTALFEYIKDSLSIKDVYKSQLISKIRTLKRKFLNTAKRSKNGEDPEISKPHDLKVYQYAKKVWGDEVEGKSVMTDVAKKSKNTKTVNNGVEFTPNPKVFTLPSSSPVVVAQNVEGNGNVEYPYLNESVQLRNYSIVPMQGLGEVFGKRGWDAIGSSNAKDLNKRWKGLLAAEAKLYLERIDLVRDQTKVMLDALDSLAP